MNNPASAGFSISGQAQNGRNGFLEPPDDPVRLWAMFSINIYGKKTRTFSTNTWEGLRETVRLELKKRPGTLWGHLRDEHRVFVVGPRKSMTNYPKKCPTGPED